MTQAGATPPVRPSPLALTVLSLLAYEPLHPYRMQRLMQLWGKDRVVNVNQRANLYKTIKRLDEGRLIAVKQTEKDQQYPERTVYELTEAGREQAEAWLVQMLSVPRNEFPEFPAALSFVMMLAPARPGPCSRPGPKRCGRTWPSSRASWATTTQLPRVTLLETEYLRAVTAAELGWLEAVIGELATGTLSWSEEELAAAVVDEAEPV